MAPTYILQGRPQYCSHLQLFSQHGANIHSARTSTILFPSSTVFSTWRQHTFCRDVHNTVPICNCFLNMAPTYILQGRPQYCSHLQLFSQHGGNIHAAGTFTILFPHNLHHAHSHPTIILHPAHLLVHMLDTAAHSDCSSRQGLYSPRTECICRSQSRCGR